MKSQNPTQPKSDARLTVLGVCIFLVAITWIVFGQTVRFDFVNYDDDRYVYKNPEVARGLTSHGLRWAFTHAHGDNWHPLTTLSHMLDCQLFGLHAGGHHFTNLVLHTIAAILLFLALRSMTGGIWQSALVATVFAIHPLRAESVAWISERKDVLSAVFFMLTLSAYLRYTKGPSVWRYLTMLIVFALGLMSKPMLVTAPFVLLLLDYWPLGRLRGFRELRNRIVEKLPLFALSAASCVATVLAQKPTTVSVEQLPLVLRIENGLVSYIVYIRQTFWPTRLAAFYPHPGYGLAHWQVVLAVALLVLISTAVIALRKRHPYLVTGWFWYLLMLFPVIGLIQVGFQAHADRYTYLPQIGLLLMVGWAVTELFASGSRATKMLVPAAGMVITIFACAAWKQVSYWGNGELLWRHTLAVTSENFVAHNTLGLYLLDHNRLDEAIPQFEKSIDAKSNYADARNNLGLVAIAKGDFNTAIIHLQEAIQLLPHDPKAHFNLATVFAQNGDADGAMAEYQKAIDSDPDYAEAHYGFGNILYEKGRIDEALSHYEQALRSQPSYAEVENNIAIALLHKGQPFDAIAHWRKSVEFKPDFIEALNNLAWVLATFPDDRLRSGPEALALAKQAMQLSNARDVSIFRTLAAACAETGRFTEAIDTAERGFLLAKQNENSALADILERDLASYRSGTPIRTAPQPTESAP